MPPVPTEPGHRVRSRTFAALDNPEYRKFYLGQGISLIGTWLQAAAVSWIVFDKTHSERMSGLVEAAGVVPGLLVGIYAGVLADRVVPRMMILVCQVFQMILALGLALLVGLGIERIWQLALIVALTRVFVTFEMPARQVFLHDLVGRANLTNAIALNSGLFNASRVIGPALAGACLAWLGEPACFLLNGGSYLAAIASLFLIRLEKVRIPSASRGPSEILGGFTYLVENLRIRCLFFLMMGFGVLGGGFSALGPSYAQRVIGTKSWGFSLLLASGGLGATFGALVLASLGGVKRRETLILSGLVIYAVALGAGGVVPPLVARSGTPLRLAVGSACLMGTGIGAIIFYATIQTTIQTSVPDVLRGRIMGIWMIIFSGSVPLGCLWSGLLAQAVGVRTVMVFSSVACGVLALTAWISGRLVETPRVEVSVTREVR